MPMLIPLRERICLIIMKTPHQIGGDHITVRLNYVVAGFSPGYNPELQGGLMKIALGLLLTASMLAAQTATDTPDAHIAAAKAAAGDDFQNLFNFQCNGPGPGGNRGAAAGGGQRGVGQRAGGQQAGGAQRQSGPP